MLSNHKFSNRKSQTAVRCFDELSNREITDRITRYYNSSIQKEHIKIVNIYLKKTLYLFSFKSIFAFLKK